MHRYPHPNYLRSFRRRAALNQPELGMLLGVSGSLIGKYETLVRTPNLETVIGAEFVFGQPARRIFPAMYGAIEMGIARRAAAFAEDLALRGGAHADVKRAFLEAIARRMASDALNI